MESYLAVAFQIPNGRLACQPATENLKFERAHHHVSYGYRNVRGKPGECEIKP
jgi:hypothetical protein